MHSALLDHTNGQVIFRLLSTELFTYVMNIIIEAIDAARVQIQKSDRIHMGIADANQKRMQAYSSIASSF